MHRPLRTLPAVLTLAALAATPARATITYLSNTDLATLGIPTPLSQAGFTTDAAGNFYVADRISNSTCELSPNFTLVNTYFEPAPTAGASAVAIGANGLINVTFRNADKIDQFNPDGSLHNTIFGLVAGSYSMSSISGVAASDTGQLFAVDPIGASVTVFSGSGQFIRQFSTGLTKPFSVAVDNSNDATAGDVFVLDTADNSVHVFTPTGAVVNTFTPSSPAVGLGTFISAAGGRIYVGSQPSGAKPTALNGFEVFSTDGTFLSAVPVAGPLAGTNASGGLTASSSGFVYQGVGTQNVYKYFDSDAWSSGTNYFNNATNGTFAAVGTGQLLGNTLNLDPSKGLVVGTTTTVAAGGTLNLSGGAFTSPTLAINDPTAAATLTAGNVLINNLNLSNGGAFTVSSVAILPLGSSLNISGPSSSLTVDQDAALSTHAFANTGTINLNNNGKLTILSPAQSNAGNVHLAGGTLLAVSDLTNNGTIQGFGLLQTYAGLTNNGHINLAGNSAVKGNLTNNPAGSIHLSGVNPNVFFNNIINNGTITIDPGAAATFYGSITGNQPSAALTLATGSLVTLASPTRIALSTSNLSLAGTTDAWNASLNLTTNALIVEVTPDSKSASLSTLRNQLAYARTHTAGIFSSTLAPNQALALLDNAITGFTTFANQPVDQNSLLITPALLGDTNADNKIDLSDLSTLLNHFGQSTPAWTDGNFDNTPTINLTDLSYVLNNFGLSTPAPTLPAHPAPEPASASLLTAAATLLLRRRKSTRP
ncbi:MAG: hypothetical protein ACTHN5_22370 [Phycisphaerae bacterium]